MDTLAIDRFRAHLLKVLATRGFIEAVEDGLDFAIKKGFEILAEEAVYHLKYIIRRCCSHFKSLNSSLKNTANPIFNIIFSLIVELYLPNLKKIIYFVCNAISVLNKLLGKSGFKKPMMINQMPVMNMPVLPFKLISKF